MEKFKDKYRIPSARLKNWDYGSNAMYFITICTKNRISYFGKIISDLIQPQTQNIASDLSQTQTQNIASLRMTELGKITEKCWFDIPNHFPFVELGEFVVMPNHIHGIIIINKPVAVAVETQNFASNLSQPQTGTQNKFGVQSQNLASIVRGFKIGVTKYARQNNLDFDWQPRFHDHIVCNNEAFEKISNYIINNPQSWFNDKFYENK